MFIYLRIFGLTNCSYPNLLHDINNLGNNPARQLRYFACAGATIKDITDSQVPLVEEADIDLATVTAGGNDINFAGILNSCVFQWQFWGSPKQCDEILNDSMDLVNSAQFSSDLDDMLRAIKRKFRNQNSVGLVFQYPQPWGKSFSPLSFPVLTEYSYNFAGM